MKVRMKVGISGTRGGQDWPGIGEILEVDDIEGGQLCAGGLAEPVADTDADVERAVAPAAETRRGPGRPRKNPEG